MNVILGSNVPDNYELITSDILILVQIQFLNFKLKDYSYYQNLIVVYKILWFSSTGSITRPLDKVYFSHHILCHKALKDARLRYEDKVLHIFMVPSAHGTTVESILQVENLRLGMVSWYITSQIELPVRSKVSKCAFCFPDLTYPSIR